MNLEDAVRRSVLNIYSSEDNPISPELEACVDLRKRLVEIVAHADASSGNFDLNEIRNVLLESFMILIGKTFIAYRSSQLFFTIPICKIGDEAGFISIKIHIWNRGIPLSEQVANPFRVHSHRYRATSLILAGKVENLIYEVSEMNKSDANSLFSISWDDSREHEFRGRSYASNTGKLVECSEISRGIYRAGDSYLIRPSEFHSSIVSYEEPTVTLFIAVKQDPNVPKSFAVGPSYERGYCVEREKFEISKNELINILNRISS